MIESYKEANKKIKIDVLLTDAMKIDTLDIVAHDHYRELLDDIKISYYELTEMFKHWSSALKKQNSVIMFLSGFLVFIIT